MAQQRVDALVARLEKGIRKTLVILGELSDDEWQEVVYEDPYPWTVRDLLAHFVSAEGELPKLAQDVAVGGPGAAEDYDYDRFNAWEQGRLAGRSPQTLLADLAAARRSTVEWVRTLAETDLDRVGRHPALGLVSLETMLTAIYGHQLIHMRDVMRLS
jgi:hypothetical protein